jgi:hypothetical protein
VRLIYDDTRALSKGYDATIFVDKMELAHQLATTFAKFSRHRDTDSFLFAPFGRRWELPDRFNGELDLARCSCG